MTKFYPFLNFFSYSLPKAVVCFPPTLLCFGFPLVVLHFLLLTGGVMRALVLFFWWDYYEPVQDVGSFEDAFQSFGELGALTAVPLWLLWDVVSLWPFDFGDEQWCGNKPLQTLSFPTCFLFMVFHCSHSNPKTTIKGLHAWGPYSATSDLREPVY